MNDALANDMARFSGISRPQAPEDDLIKRTDTYSMLHKTAKDLRSIDYTLGRCISIGLGNFHKLQITTKEELIRYR